MFNLKHKKMTKVTSIKIEKVKKNKTSSKKENAENIKNNVKAERDLMYQYPNFEGSTDEVKAEKKKFRAAARRAKASFQKKVGAADKKDKAALISEANKWALDIYTKNFLPSF
jgi:hypothetical protein